MSKVNIESLSPTRKRLVVPVSADSVKTAETKVVSAISRQAKIPGFREGKAPEAMVRSRYAQVISDELKREVISESYEKALVDAKLELCAVVDIENDDIAPGRNSVVTVTVDVYPQFTTPKYKELTVKLPKVGVDDKEITKTIDLIRGQRAQFTPVERAAQNGDYVRLGYHGTLDGKAVSEIAADKPMYGTQKNTWEEAGNHDYGIKAISEGVVGMKKGDKKTVTMEFTKDFAEAPALAGKKVSYDLEVFEVREKKMPELNEEFFKSVGVKDIEELKTQIKASLEQRAREDQEAAKRAQLSDALVGSVEFPLPESLEKGESQQILEEIIQENHSRGVSDDMIEQNEKELIASAKQAATKRVKLRLILREIAKAEKIEVSEDDFKRWIYNEAMSRQTTPEKIMKDLSGDRERMVNLTQALKLSKAMKIVIDSAKVEEAEKK
jgi:trigger factor